MGELGLNKILGAALATGLGMMGLATLPSLVFGGEAATHHGEEHAPVTLSEQMCEQFHYCIEIAEAAATGEVEAVFDLGAALLTADIAKGERAFAGQCSTCHTITPGGTNGTGPNLHNVVGAGMGKHSGFKYSGVLTNAASPWTYEALNDWIKSPGSYMKGTTMSFAGIKKDADRANVIAYLASNTEGAPPFPAPMAAPAVPAPAEGEAVPADAAAAPTEGEVPPAGDGVPAEAPAEVVQPT